VLARAIARDLFDGQALAKTMASITIATAAARGSLRSSAARLIMLFGWRSEFAFVAVFAICAGAAYAAFVGETKAASDSSLHPLSIAGTYLGLVRDARFAAPASTAGLLMAGLFAVFSGAPRVLLEGFGLSPVMLGLLFAGVVFLVFAAGMLAPRLSARFGLYRAVWLAWDWPLWEASRCFSRSWSRGTRCCHFSAPLRSSCSVWESRARCRVRPRYRHSVTRPAPPQPCLVSRKWPERPAGHRSQLSSTATRPSGLEAVLALTSVLALVLHGWKRRPE
jgi:hypothetical protein